MSDKPSAANGYPHEITELAKSTCLYIATRLGDLLDEMVIVGGLVPTLLLPEDQLPEGAEPHVGSMDVDMGLSLGLLNEERYRKVSERFRDAGFRPDTSESGQPTRQRWRMEGEESVTVDFLIPVAKPSSKAGTVQHIESDFGAIKTPGLELAFQDRKEISLKGKTIKGEVAERSIQVCEAGAFVVLKALAHQGRGENKDAYDLYYMIRNYGDGVEDAANRLKPLLDNENAKKALEILQRDFTNSEGVGPRHVADFLTGGRDAEIQADVVGFVADFLNACKQR